MIILFSILAFVMLLVFLNSFVFSIQEVRADCYNSLDAQLCEKVVNASGIKLNKNILFLSEKKAIENINKEMGGKINVINIERKFPDKVWIHFVNVVPVVALQKDDGNYVICDSNLNIADTDVPAANLSFDQTVDQVDKNIDSATNRPIVLVTIKGHVNNPQLQAPLSLTDANSLLGLRTVIDTINRLDYREYDFVRLLKEIDFTGYSDTAVNPEIVLKMRDGGKDSISITIQNTKVALLQKIQHAISAYEQYLSNKLTFAKNQWTCYMNTKNEIIVSG